MTCLRLDIRPGSKEKNQRTGRTSIPCREMVCAGESESGVASKKLGEGTKRRDVLNITERTVFYLCGHLACIAGIPIEAVFPLRGEGARRLFAHNTRLTS